MKKVILSQRAFLSMLAEVYERVDTETGGIFLGHREGDTWYVLESIEPGPKSTFTPTFFEYDDAYVTYRANKIRRLYKCSVELLGLWHRHPSLMKVFSSTDDVTNKTYSDMLGGAISGIVTLGNGFEITMYYVPSNVRYEKIECIVDDEQIPTDYLSYYNTEYYKKLINDAAAKTYGNKYRKDEEQDISRQPELKKDADENDDTERSNNSPARSLNQGVFSKIKQKVGCMINDLLMFEDNEYDDSQTVNETEEYEEENDIAYIFDTIEPEIEYLQQLKADGKILFKITKKKDSKVKDVLILTIKDLRQIEEYVYKLGFFIKKDKIWVIDEDGNIRPYTNNTIDTVLGGKS